MSHMELFSHNTVKLFHFSNKQTNILHVKNLLGQKITMVAFKYTTHQSILEVIEQKGSTESLESHGLLN